MTTALTTKIAIRDRDGNVVREKEVATYAGLLAKAHEEGLESIRTELRQIPASSNGDMAIAVAVVRTKNGTYTGIGDACPSNVNRMIVPHIIRMAETRAKARALRDAVNIGIVALDELGCDVIDDGVDEPTNVRPLRQTPTSGEGRSRGSRSNDMSDKQRKLLFRLLAEQGIEGDQAERHLVGEAGVEHIGQVTKRVASTLIERWMDKGRRRA